jgi:hypothetical protein
MGDFGCDLEEEVVLHITGAAIAIVASHYLGGC